jgi:hypothetical protein
MGEDAEASANSKSLITTSGNLCTNFVSKYSIGNLKVVSIIRFFILKNISKNALSYQKGKKWEEARSKQQKARRKKGRIKRKP